jgi:hypothetical protein
LSVEGPAYDAHSYAVFFENPNGNRLEICYRESNEVPVTDFDRSPQWLLWTISIWGLVDSERRCDQAVHELVNAFDRSKARQIFATLIRLPGDFDAAKATLHDAFARGDRSLGTSWRVGQLAIRAFTNAGLF